MEAKQQDLLKQLTDNHMHCFVPVITKEKMALNTGLGITTVNAMLLSGALPAHLMGTLQLVNLARIFVQRDLLPMQFVINPLSSEISEKFSVNTHKQTVPLNMPVVSKQRFAELVGTSSTAVQGWINRGHLPTVKSGKYRLIDIMALFSECISTGEHLYQFKGLPN